MEINPRELSILNDQAHDLMRNIDGLHPQEAFDELLKYLFFKINNELVGPELNLDNILLSDGTFKEDEKVIAAKMNELLESYLKKANSWSEHLWHDHKFHLSNSALLAIHNIFKQIEFNKISLDIKSAALRSFLTPEVRRGLGIYLTPDDVVRAMVEYVQPKVGQRVLDPACGSGTFLIETIKYWEKSSENNIKYQVWGIDKNPRMLLLSDLNLGYVKSCKFNKTLDDFLCPKNACSASWLKPNYFDVIFTNPPFGVILDSNNYNLKSFATCINTDGTLKKHQQSEIVFLEQCLKFLKPGGLLGIVLPKSIITNTTFSHPRSEINKLGYVTAIICLPPETFQIAGTQTNTVILFMKKYTINEKRNDRIKIGIADVNNVGYDSTGRSRSGNQLLNLAVDLKHSIVKAEPNGQCGILTPIRKEQSLTMLKDLLLDGNKLKHRESKSHITLDDLALYIGNGVTPARNQYSSDGLFILKVGNLTGNGIDWYPRERNFVDYSEKEKRIKNRKPLLLKKNDIVLTSSAHTPKYIAQKVDMVTEVPQYIGGEATYVGEIMLIRVDDQKIDPFILLSYLRSNGAKEIIQGMIRGQTAHLYPKDLKNLPIPKKLLNPNSEIIELSELLKEEMKLEEKKNDVNFKKHNVLASINF